MKAPSTSLDFVRLAREQAAARRLTRGQAQVLNLLASYANRRGECYPSITVLAERAMLSARHTERLLGELGRLGLVQSSRRGRGCSARRRLCLDAPMPAPPCPCGTQPLFDAMLTPSFDEPAPVAAPVEATVSDPPPVASEPPSDGGQKEQQEGETTEGSARSAPSISDSSDQAVSRAVQSRLETVLGILDASHGLLVEPFAVNAALAAYPEASGHDHEQAAYIVQSWSLEQGGMRSESANRLLMAALRRQTRPATDRGINGPRHTTRVRRAPAAMAPVTGGYMRQD